MISKLSSYEKFRSGADLWCLFFEPKRELFKAINWRVQFMIQKIKEPAMLTWPLLIESSFCLPNQYLLCLPEDFSAKKTYEIWMWLKKPSIRLFLPLNSKEVFLELWLKDSSTHKVSYYREKTPHKRASFPVKNLI